MLSARTRASALATMLAVGGLFAAASPAHAANATIAVDSEVAFTGASLGVSGTCADKTGTAVIIIEQGGEELVVEEVDVDKDDPTFAVDLDISQLSTDFATASVECLHYTTEEALGDDSVEFLAVEGEEVPVIDVTVSPRTVAIGGTLTISATCPAGTASAVVMAGNEDADEPFLEEEVTPAGDGTVTVRARVAEGTGPAPEAGAAGAAVMCMDEDGLLPAAYGFAEFRISAAAAAPVARAASASPELANTGSDAGPLTAIAVAMIAAGAAAIRLSRRA